MDANQEKDAIITSLKSQRSNMAFQAMEQCTTIDLLNARIVELQEQVKQLTPKEESKTE